MAKESNAVAVVTGGTAGIGLEACKQLAAKGIDVVLTSRSDEKGKAAALEIKECVRPNSVNVDYVVMELSSLTLVADGCHQLLNQPKIDYLLLNAGFMDTDSSRKTTGDGVEQTVAVNHVAGTLIAKMLLPHMEKTSTVARPMVTFVSSDLHNLHSVTRAAHKVGKPLHDDHVRYLAQTGDLDGSEMMKLDEKHPQFVSYDGSRAYKYSKLLNVLTATRIQRNLMESQSMVQCNSMEPGFIPASDLSRQVKAVMGSTGAKLFVWCLYHGPVNWMLRWALGQPVRMLEEGGRSEVFALTEGHGGMYYRLDKEDPPSPLAKETEVVDGLYDATMELLKGK